MPPKINLYFEGSPVLRPGFLVFLGEALNRARLRGIAVRLVFCKARALKSFRNALRDEPNAVNLLVVDAEEPVTAVDPWMHLRDRQRNRFARPGNVEPTQGQLMVQIMESWFLVDREALEAYYGKGFRASCLPVASRIEDVPKETVLSSLARAVAGTKKTEYHKTAHAPELLALIDPAKVRAASPWCDRLFKTIEAAIEAE